MIVRKNTSVEKIKLAVIWAKGRCSLSMRVSCWQDYCPKVTWWHGRP